MILPTIDRESGEPIRRQIYQKIRDQILSGAIGEGDPLPSTRQLAADLCAARSTVVEAYEMLLAEGIVTSRQGAQTVVSKGLAMGNPTEPAVPERKNKLHKPIADFSTGKPDLSQFPREKWAQLLFHTALDLPQSEFGYRAQGFAPVRRMPLAFAGRGMPVWRGNLHHGGAPEACAAHSGDCLSEWRARDP